MINVLSFVNTGYNFHFVKKERKKKCIPCKVYQDLNLSMDV